MTTSTRNMKILQVLPALSAGGAEGFVTNLGVSLAERGAEVRFFLLAGVRGERGRVLHQRLRRAGVEVVGAEEHNVRSPANLLRLVRLIRSWRPDIVQANLYSAEIVVAAARVFSIGSGACCVRRLASTEQSAYRSVTVVRMVDRFYRQTIACSPAVAEAYRDFMGAKHKSRLVTVPNGGLLRPATTTAEETRQAREILGIPGDAFVVAHIGRMFPGKELGGGLETDPKAHDVILRAFAKAFVGDSEAVLVLVGDGSLRSEAEALTRSLGIERQVRFLGQQPEPWPALDAADVFCFPSRYEGLPNVLPEAASCGLPVVASDIPEIRHLYPGDAWLLSPVDNISRFAQALRVVRDRREEFACKARAAAQGFRERFSMKVCAEKYIQAYEMSLKPGKVASRASDRLVLGRGLDENRKIA